MTRVLVTGGTGVLGRQLVPRLVRDGYTVRVMSRRPSPPTGLADVEWAQAFLATGANLDEAVSGANVIVHAASSPFNTRAVDVHGTWNLLRAARKSAVEHLIFVSIVGIDTIPYYYYRAKLEVESLVHQAGIPWSTLRATQFHTLIDLLLRGLLRFPVGVLPGDFRFQPVDPGEAADRLAAAVHSGPAGRLPDFGGPETHTLWDLAEMWLEARGLRRRIINLRLPGGAAEGFRRGLNTVPGDGAGVVTWREWLQKRYGIAVRPTTASGQSGRRG